MSNKTLFLEGVKPGARIVSGPKPGSSGAREIACYAHLDVQYWIRSATLVPLD